ncbi:MAG: multicopper oxidase family protein [Gorillibacterium sp.]|nr:multicopper oxidase family protein [Gorillibacterium sp.]
MRKNLIRVVVLAGMLAVILAGCSNNEDNNMKNNKDNNMEGMDHSKMDMPTKAPKANESSAKTVNMDVIRQTEFTLTAKQSNLEVESGRILPVWTYNNSVPGPEIRVKQGDKVTITLKNELPEPTSIHWHGVPVPISMDGIPGVTMNAVQPGNTFTYEFTATVPGTYWYHSHQDSVNQVDRGLYGAFIVEAKEDPIDRDYTIMLDEWNSMGTANMDMGNMSNTTGDHDMDMYDLLSINGKTGAAIDKLMVKQGDKVRLRLINAGYKSHILHLHGHEWKVTATDGQPINGPQLLKDTFLSIAPGERYDVEFEANNPGNWFMEAHGSEPGVKGMKVIIAYEGSSEQDQPDDAVINLPFFDLTRYGQTGKAAFTLAQQYDLEYTMNLGTEEKNGQPVYTINGKGYPDTDAVKVEKGDKVKVILVNNSKSDDHPMHLHGHFFQVLSKNGKPVEGSPIVKDTLNLKPGEQYVVAFEADNPGDWMFHCHDLHHASAGMVTHMLYTDYKNDFVADPKEDNKPE